MPDVRTVKARSQTFIDNWDGSGRWAFALDDGSCLYVVTTPAQAALNLVQLSEFVTRAFVQEKK
jgi:hypothetical protein